VMGIKKEKPNLDVNPRRRVLSSWPSGPSYESLLKNLTILLTSLASHRFLQCRHLLTETSANYRTAS
ncbi:hypothetical protein AVEN_140923-1, partial [Araneus ventricosus]